MLTHDWGFERIGFVAEFSAAVRWVYILAWTILTVRRGVDSLVAFNRYSII
jgi:hypothetical protein